MIPQPKYKIGQKVWNAGATWGQTPQPCKICQGLGRIEASHVMGTSSIQCPMCYGKGTDGACSFVPYVKLLTVGGIRVETWARKGEEVGYMCKETGVGSGTIYYEPRLFASEREAKTYADKETVEAQKHFEDTHTKNEHGNWVSK